MSNKSFFGIILIFIGTSIFANQIFNINLGQFWPLLLISAGVFSLFQRGSQQTGSVILIAVGSLFLLGNLNVLNQDLVRYVIPAVFVFLGLYVIFWKNKTTAPNNENLISYLAIMGGTKDVVKSQQFEGGSIMTVMGGAEIDLVGSEMKENEANLEIISIMGGVELKVPLEWDVKISGTPIMAGWENKTTAQTSVQKNKILNVNITALMGGVEIRN
jgi:predicted membrane protein